MKNKIPLLTVGIPTYNRPETLEKIIKQLKKESDQDFILLISDDSTNDETKKMIQKYIKSMPNLIYYKNKKNLGFSENVARLYELSTTRYIWFLCDDDTVIPNAIKNIADSLKKYQPTVAVFNAIWADSYGREKIAGVKKDLVYSNANQLNNYNPLMRTTFLSILVVEKIKSISTIKKLEYKDNIFFQVTLSLMLLNKNFNFCEIALPIVKRNVGYKYGEFFKFYLVDHMKAISLVGHNFDKDKFKTWSIKHIPTAFLLYISQKIGLFKYNGRPTSQTIKNVIKFYGIHSIFIATFPILYYLIPTGIIKFVYKKRLTKYHGQKKGNKIFQEYINRAYTDSRKTGFVSYR